MTKVDDDIKYGMIDAISPLIHRDYEGASSPPPPPPPAPEGSVAQNGRSRRAGREAGRGEGPGAGPGGGHAGRGILPVAGAGGEVPPKSIWTTKKSAGTRFQ